MKSKIIAIAAGVLLFLFGFTLDCHAELVDGNVFANASWEQVFEDELTGEMGVVQSVCATEQYIIAIENISEDPNQPDVVSAYYRNNTDEEGNEVVPYTLAKRTKDTNWEHGNGMTYNPNTKEIYVSLYTSGKPENRGCLFVMDPDTLAYKRTIKVSEDYNILGIGYREESDQYVIQTDASGGYSFKILDAQFQVVEDLGEYAHTTVGGNFQDLEVSGDYIINFPLTFGMGIGDFIYVYSISGKSMLSSTQLDFAFTNVVIDEPESLVEIEPGVFLAAVNVTEDSGAKKIRFYKTTVPYYFDVAATAENGQIVGEVQKVLRGANYSLKFKPEEGYELSKILINGEKRSVEKGSHDLVIENIQQNQKIQVVFKKTPVVTLKPANVEKKVKNVPALAVAVGAGIGVVGAGVILLWAYIIRVRRERKRKALRKKRQREMAQYASAVLAQSRN